MANWVGYRFGNYDILRTLGSGGFADVYLGKHRYLNTQAAVKILHAHLIGDGMALFRQEGENVAGLIHSNIVRVLEFGIENGIPYLVMDYAPDGSLRAKHPKNEVLPLPTVISYIQQIASALQYAHDNKIVHRDVKPDNILLAPHGKVLLSDFGISTTPDTDFTGRTQDGSGTVGYMAPEHIEGHPHRASDQYSLAIVVYEWICGVRPFTGNTWTEVAIQHMTIPPAPLHEKIPGIPLEVEQVVLKALSKDYRERFESVKAFATALEEACALPNEPYYPERVAQAIRQCYYQSSKITQRLGIPKPVNQEDVQKKSPRGTEGYKRPFEHGAIYWTERSGAQPIWWGIDGLHRRHKGVHGIMGFPLTAELDATPSPQKTKGKYQRFEGERDFPEDVLAVPVRYGASAYNSEKYGSHLISGGIGICYERLGGTSGKLGFPTSSAQNVGPSQHPKKTKGMYKNFEGGRIYWSEYAGAHPVWGEIGEFYKNIGGVTSRLGFPLSHEISAQSSQGTRGVYQRFEGGPSDATPVGNKWEHKGVSVYRSKHGVFPVWGGIGVRYEQLGNVSSFLGFPISPEEKLADESPEGWVQRFEVGAIFWCEAYGGVDVASSFLALHEEFGGIKGQFGFPKFPAKPGNRHPDQQLQEFEGGVIYLAHDARAKQWDNVNEVIEIVNRMYERILGRRADEGALITYGSQLHRGERSVREIVKTLGQSPEYRRHLTEMTKTVEEAVKMCFEHFWGQKANESEMKTYVELAQAQGFETVVDKLVDDEEYRNKFGENQVPG